ncbi:hypothetical protein roselon_00290 [Roseibacterium elongatum DSM 19469]|uniref:Lipoprotein n=1 Tax=Roseicyclus elongatus DSM 19469 TaxID=1294273 RepID=W8RP07_9RHOB|nr:hypothetical protein [Roseibacterium elongatum]AHM02743.1 hypothetical protein roselon_00290 [Roseibacterium elongatum DSM 19469]
MRAKLILPTTLFAAVLALSGCMASDLERAGIGALGGGVTAAALNGSIGTGILIGAAGGALCDDVNLC